MSTWNDLDVMKRFNFPEIKLYEPPKKAILTVIPDVVVLTNAEADSYSSQALTCHDLRDYRRTDFEFEFLPEVKIIFEELLKEVYNFEDV